MADRDGRGAAPGRGAGELNRTAGPGPRRPEDGPPGMVKGVGVPGRRPRTHAPEGWPGPVDFALDPGRTRRNGVTLLVFCALGLVAYLALGGGQVLGWGIALAVLALVAGSTVRVQGDPSALRFTREGMEFVGTRPPKRHRWADISDIDLVEMPHGFGRRPGRRGDMVVRLTLKPKVPYGEAGYEVIPTGAGAAEDDLAWTIEGWWRYATRDW